MCKKRSGNKMARNLIMAVLVLTMYASTSDVLKYIYLPTTFNGRTVHHSRCTKTLLCGYFTHRFEANTYVGCYKDKAARILDGKFTNGQMTVEKCIQTCSQDGSHFAGVEYANQCFCGKRLRHYKRLADSECSTNCGGNSNQKCGGTWKISVYTTNKYVGCFEDDGSRMLDDIPMKSSSSMTTKSCIKHCRDNGKRFALTQYASQCFCGNSLDFYKQRADSECNYKCAGTQSENCGGFWRGSLYVI